MPKLPKISLCPYAYVPINTCVLPLSIMMSYSDPVRHLHISSLLSLRTNCTHTIHSCHYVQTVHIQSTPVTTYKLYTYNPLLSLRTNCTHTIHSCHYVQTVHIQSTPVTMYKLYTYNPLLSLRTNCMHTIHSCHYVQTVHI